MAVLLLLTGYFYSYMLLMHVDVSSLYYDSFSKIRLKKKQDVIVTLFFTGEPEEAVSLLAWWWTLFHQRLPCGALSWGQRSNTLTPVH